MSESNEDISFSTTRVTLINSCEGLFSELSQLGDSFRILCVSPFITSFLRKIGRDRIRIFEEQTLIRVGLYGELTERNRTLIVTIRDAERGARSNFTVQGMNRLGEPSTDLHLTWRPPVRYEGIE